MNINTPFVEFLIIGVHTSLVLGLVLMRTCGVPFSVLTGKDAQLDLLLWLLPLVYLVGMTFDQVFYRLLSKQKDKIKKLAFQGRDYPDEYLALNHAELYNAYEVRVRRIRIVGAAVFNWPLLALAILLHTGMSTFWHAASIFVANAVLGYTSYFTWAVLYRRAYEFRATACRLIQAGHYAETTGCRDESDAQDGG